MTIMDLSSPDIRFKMFFDTSALNSQRILVNSDDFFVQEDPFSVFAHVCNVTTNKQRCLNERPESEMGLVFSCGHSTVTDLQHVWVIPSTGTSEFLKSVLFIKDIKERRPPVRDITCSSP